MFNKPANLDGQEAMIAAGISQEFVPYGRKHLDYHPGDVYLPVDVSAEIRTCLDSSRDLLCALKGVSIQDRPNKEQWQLRKSIKGDGEEELYMSGQTVVWSCGSGYGARKVYKSLTLENPIQQVLWCKFCVSGCKPLTITSYNINKDSVETLSCISVLDTAGISVFSMNGEEYKVALPFQVSRAWSIKYGLLFERIISDRHHSKSETFDKSPIIFSMLHPMEEVAPVVKNISSPFGRANYCTNVSQEIVFTSSEPSLIVLYHKIEGIHSVWKVRRTNTEEVNMNIHNEFNSLSNTPTSYSVGQLQSTISHSHSSHTPSYNISSPFHSHLASRVSSPTGFHSKQSSPSVSGLTHMATLSRSQSPLLTGSLHQPFVFTPPPSQNWIYSAAGSPKSVLWELVEPLAPDICLEQMYIESQNHSLGEKASKIFITVDICNQNFLCLLFKEHQHLRLIKFEESNDQEQLIFGTVSTILARDADILPALNLLMTIDVGFTITLYTGITKICKVHIPMVAGPFSILSGTSSRRTSLQFGSPRRSSLITSSRPPSALDAKFDEELKLLSPVPVHMNDTKIIEDSLIDDYNLPSLGTVIGLKDSVMNRVNLETSNGTFYRISLPKMSNSIIVTKLLQALNSVLPREIAIQIFAKWYATRNAPGSSDLTIHSELKTFLLCLLSNMGYDTDIITLGGILKKDLSLSPVAVKKAKTSEYGTDEDWSYLTSSMHSKMNQDQRNSIGYHFNEKFPVNTSDLSEKENSINIHAPLLPYLSYIHLALHLVYEDCKLNILQWDELPSLACFLYQISRDLRLPLYQNHYWQDFPDICCTLSDNYQLSEDDMNQLHSPPYFTSSPPNIFEWLQSLLLNKNFLPFLYIANVTKSIRDIILMYSLLINSTNKKSVNDYLQSLIVPGRRFVEEIEITFFQQLSVACKPEENLILFLTHLGINNEDLNNLPLGVALPIREVILHCRKKPSSDWPVEAYTLIGRQDLAAAHAGTVSPPHKSKSSDSVKHVITKEDEDGLDHLDHEVLQLRFSQDQRIYEVYRMLQSSKPVKIVLQQRPEVSDHDFIEEQERHLYTLCIRTMALPIGRGMFTLRTYSPVVTETLPIPKLCLTGRSPPRNTTVDLSHIDVPANMNMWPLFHNGVAAGLRIAPNASQIDSTWIVYNKPSTISNDTPVEHAGFLMALGLNGHLSNLATMSVHDYLCKGHELTSVGLLLGLAAAKRGTMDLACTKVMSIHVEALLPPTSTELNVPAVVQVAAVLGIGLLYQGSGHRHMADVLLGEIGRPPGPEMEHCIDRESYALAAGLALGLVTLGKGSEVAGLSDLPMADQLYHFMIGGHKRPLTGIHKEKHKSPSYQIREGDSVNIDVTSPGATLALGMMFFNTGNIAIADWMTIPDSKYLLDMVRPDFLLLRTLSKGLILWDNIHPSIKWIENHLPEIVSTYAFKRVEVNTDIDYETMSQAYCNIVAGACMVLGLKFAGSANDEAFQTLMHYAKSFLLLSGKPVADQAGKNTIETCLSVIVLSLAIVMAGTGDLDVLRICRHLRSRISQPSGCVLYGFHMAIHMALGLLFLGGGKFTLSTNPFAVGAMVCAFFPKFPTHSNDNRYHLQAFRHLYVLAVERRFIIPRDIDTGKAVYANLLVKFKDTSWYKNVKYKITAPCLLPEPKLLKEVRIDDSRYWPIVFEDNKNWDMLKHLLENNGNLYLKQKAGYLPYTSDPKGLHNLLTKTLAKDNVKEWVSKTKSMNKFSCDPIVYSFATSFLKPVAKTMQEIEWQQQLSSLLYECALEEKMEILPTCLALCQMAEKMKKESNMLELWQLKLMLANQQRSEATDKPPLLSSDFTLAIKNQLEKVIGILTQGQKEYIVSYLSGKKNGFQLPPDLAPFLVFYDIPSSGSLKLSLQERNINMPILYLQLRHMQMTVHSIMVLLTVLQSRN